MSNYITEEQIDQLAGEVGKALRKEKKVDIIIRPDGVSKFWEGCINGCNFRLLRDVQISVPESLYRVVRESERVAIAAKKIETAYTKGNGKKLGA